MKTEDSQKIVHEIAESTDAPEEVVSQMYTDAVQAYQREARILDYVPLFAAKKVRNELRHKHHHKHCQQQPRAKRCDDHPSPSAQDHDDIAQFQVWSRHRSPRNRPFEHLRDF